MLFCILFFVFLRTGGCSYLDSYLEAYYCLLVASAAWLNKYWYKKLSGSQFRTTSNINHIIIDTFILLLAVIRGTLFISDDDTNIFVFHLPFL